MLENDFELHTQQSFGAENYLPQLSSIGDGRYRNFM